MQEKAVLKRFATERSPGSMATRLMNQEWANLTCFSRIQNKDPEFLCAWYHGPVFGGLLNRQNPSTVKAKLSRPGVLCKDNLQGYIANWHGLKQAFKVYVESSTSYQMCTLKSTLWHQHIRISRSLGFDSCWREGLWLFITYTAEGFWMLPLAFAKALFASPFDSPCKREGVSPMLQLHLVSPSPSVYS